MSAAPSIPSDADAGEGGGVRGIRTEVIEFFEDMGRALRLPPSIGRIYGLLFAASRPLPFDEISRELQLSKGAISQGLQVLQDLKAVHAEKVDGDRRTFYRPETSLRRLTRFFLNDIMVPRLAEGQQRVSSLERRLKGVEKDPDLTTLTERLRSLRIWQRKLSRLLPWVARLAMPGRETGEDSETRIMEE